MPRLRPNRPDRDVNVNKTRDKRAGRAFPGRSGQTRAVASHSSRSSLNYARESLFWPLLSWKRQFSVASGCNPRRHGGLGGSFYDVWPFYSCLDGLVGLQVRKAHF
jgi:hypothetical protein